MSSLYNPLASDGTAASLEPDKGPFSLKDEASYAAWRSAKLAAYPKDASELRVTVRDLGSPTPSEREALRGLCARANMALYDSGPLGTDAVKVRPALRALADALNMQHVEDHRSGGADGIVAIEVANEGRPRRLHSIFDPAHKLAHRRLLQLSRPVPLRSGHAAALRARRGRRRRQRPARP